MDTQGLPHAIAVTTADVTDRGGALMAWRFHKTALSEVNNVLTDGGYTGQPFADALHDTLGATVEVVKRVVGPICVWCKDQI